MVGLEKMLQDDGTPDGGCKELPVIPKEDPEGQCPVGSLTEDEEEGIALALFVFLNLILVVGFVSIFYCVCCRGTDATGDSCCCVRRKTHQLDPLQGISSGVADANKSTELPEIA